MLFYPVPPCKPFPSTILYTRRGSGEFTFLSPPVHIALWAHMHRFLSTTVPSASVLFRDLCSIQKLSVTEFCLRTSWQHTFFNHWFPSVWFRESNSRSTLPSFLRDEFILFKKFRTSFLTPSKKCFDFMEENIDFDVLSSPEKSYWVFNQF